MKNVTKKKRLSADAKQANLREYLRRSPDVTRALQKLAHHGCELEILAGLAERHVDADRNTASRALKHSLSSLDGKLADAAEVTYRLMLQMRELGFNAELARKLQLDKLWLLLKRHEHLCQQFQTLRLSPPPEKIRIHLPLLCIYVQQVTGKPHYVDLAAVLRAFHGAVGANSKEFLSEDAVRHARQRYATQNPENNQQLTAATRSFLASRQAFPGNPTRLLLALAYSELELLGETKADKDNVEKKFICPRA